MKIPVKVTEEQIALFKNGNIVVVPKYGEYQNINNSMLKYHQYEPTVYLHDEETDEWFIVDVKEVDKVFRYDLFKDAEIKDLYNTLYNFKHLLDKLPKWIKKLYKIKY